MKALIAIAAVGVALFVSTTTAAAAPGSDAVGRWGKPTAVEKSGRWHLVVPPSAIGRIGGIGRFGAIGWLGGVSSAGFRW